MIEQLPKDWEIRTLGDVVITLLITVVKPLKAEVGLILSRNCIATPTDITKLNGSIGHR